MSRTLKRAVVPENPSINVTSLFTPRLATLSGKQASIKEEEEEEEKENGSETENENPVKASPSLSFFQESPVLSSRRVQNNKVSRIFCHLFFLFCDLYFSFPFFFPFFAETVKIPALVLVFFPAP